MYQYLLVHCLLTHQVGGQHDITYCIVILLLAVHVTTVATTAVVDTTSLDITGTDSSSKYYIVLVISNNIVECTIYLHVHVPCHKVVTTMSRGGNNLVTTWLIYMY